MAWWQDVAKLLKTPAPAPAGRLDGARVHLRPPSLDDWQAWADLRNASSAFLTPWEPRWSPESHSRAVFQRRTRQMAEEWRQDRGYAFFIFENRDAALLGGITLSNVRRGVAQSATVAYWIGETHARQGIMTEALGCALGFAFDHLGLHRVDAACRPENEASCGLLMKTGFREEGYARKYLRINGVWQDHLLFGLLRDERDERDERESGGTRPMATKAGPSS